MSMPESLSPANSEKKSEKEDEVKGLPQTHLYASYDMDGCVLPRNSAAWTPTALFLSAFSLLWDTWLSHQELEESQKPNAQSVSFTALLGSNRQGPRLNDINIMENRSRCAGTTMETLIAGYQWIHHPEFQKQLLEALKAQEIASSTDSFPEAMPKFLSHITPRSPQENLIEILDQVMTNIIQNSQNSQGSQSFTEALRLEDILETQEAWEEEKSAPPETAAENLKARSEVLLPPPARDYLSAEQIDSASLKTLPRIELNKFLLLDVLDKSKPSWWGGREREADHDLCFDATKISLLYTQMHLAAAEHPEEDRIHFYFYDDRIEILQTLQDFFTHHHQLIPQNISLTLSMRDLSRHRYFNPSKEPAIQGSGEIDVNYQESFKIFWSIFAGTGGYRKQVPTGENQRNHLVQSFDPLLFMYHRKKLDLSFQQFRQHLQSPEATTEQQDQDQPLRDSTLSRTIYALKTKASDLYRRGHTTAGIYAFMCANRIEVMQQHAPQDLKTKAPQYIQYVQPLLNQHRGCGNLLNTLLFLVTGVVGYILGLGIKAAIRGHWSFALFGSESGQKLTEIEKAVRSAP
jgi:hypothetical protein